MSGTVGVEGYARLDGGHGMAWHGMAWHGMARQGTTAARWETRPDPCGVVVCLSAGAVLSATCHSSIHSLINI